MKSIERLLRALALVAVIALTAAACTGNSEGAGGGDDATPTAVAESVASSTPVTEGTLNAAEPAPTATPEPVLVTDDERIAAAIAALDADGTRDLGLIAWDILDSQVRDDGDVTLTICGWTGDTVFDKVYASIWAINATGTVPTASEITTAPTAGDCLNTQLIESALTRAEEFADFWVETVADPASFAEDPRGEELLTPEYFEVAEVLTAQWASDSITIAGLTLDRPLNTGELPLLLRRFRTADDQRLEVAVCHAMGSYGTYKNSVLIDDGRPSSGGGPHAVNAIVLVLDATEASWEVDGSYGLVWSDCGSNTTWPANASAWRPDVADFAVLPV